MFGGVGLYSGELFFGLIDDDTLFFKTDGSNAADYIARNMPRFMPFPERPEAVMAYYQVPADIIEDAESLVAWARKSVAVALASRAAKARPEEAASRAARKSAKKKKASRRREAALADALDARLRGAHQIGERLHRRRTGRAAAHIGARRRRRPSCRRSPHPVRRAPPGSRTPVDAAHIACRARAASCRRPRLLADDHDLGRRRGIRPALRAGSCGHAGSDSARATRRAACVRRRSSQRVSPSR